jgi:hypothetical protein
VCDERENRFGKMMQFVGEKERGNDSATEQAGR